MILARCKTNLTTWLEGRQKTVNGPWNLVLKTSHLGLYAARKLVKVQEKVPVRVTNVKNHDQAPARGTTWATKNQFCGQC